MTTEVLFDLEEPDEMVSFGRGRDTLFIGNRWQLVNATLLSWCHYSPALTLVRIYLRLNKEI
jgi:hypothetical protein